MMICSSYAGVSFLDMISLSLSITPFWKGFENNIGNAWEYWNALYHIISPLYSYSIPALG